MEKVFNNIILFVVTYLVVYLLYYIFSIRKARKNKNKLPVEVQYLIIKYKIDIDKITYKSLMRFIALIGSFDIALIVTVVLNLDGYILPFIAGFILAIPLIFISFKIIGAYYKRKGMIKSWEIQKK